MTGLGPDRADAARLPGLVRGHRGIEGGPHYRRDVTLGGDASRARKGSAPEAMAAPRNALTRPPQPLNESSPAAAIRKCTNCFPQALMLLGLPPIE